MLSFCLFFYQLQPVVAYKRKARALFLILLSKKCYLDFLKNFFIADILQYLSKKLFHLFQSLFRNSNIATSKKKEKTEATFWRRDL